MTPAKPMPLPPWPEKPQMAQDHPRCIYEDDWDAYERALAAAWEARCRLAMEHYYHHPKCAMWQGVQCDCGYHEGLFAIGTLPALPLPAPLPAPQPEGTGE